MYFSLFRLSRERNLNECVNCEQRERLQFGEKKFKNIMSNVAESDGK